MNSLNVWNEDMREMIARPLNAEAETWHARHRPPLSLATWKRKRAALKETILEKAGSFPAAPDLAMEVHGAIQRKGYRINTQPKPVGGIRFCGGKNYEIT